MARTERIIVVAGATGQQGGAAARALLAAGWRVRALTRDPGSAAARALAGAGAEVVAADLADRGSLDAAVTGAHGVFSVQPGALSAGVPAGFGPDEEVRWGRNLAEAASDVGVRQLVYASVAAVGRHTGVPVFESKAAVEDHLRGTGQPVTVLRPVSFMENYAEPAFGLAGGTLATPLAPDAAEQLVAVDDIGAAAALAFAEPDRYLGATLELAGDALTPAELVAAIGAATGRAVRYVQVPLDGLRAKAPDAARAFDFLNGGGYRVDLAAARARQPGLLTFDGWLAAGGAARLAALLDRS